MASTNPARGMRDFLPIDVRKRNYVIGIIKEVYESFGFEPLETPAVENIETLLGKYGEEGNQLVFKILKRGEKLRQETGDGKQELKESNLADLALRYDLTVPLARVVANNKNELPKFFKRYQIQPVWRADRPARGRFREFYQCDVDAIGSSSMAVEAELISAVCSILERLGFEEFTLNVNHREYLKGVLEYSGVPSDQHTDVLVSIDKLDKIGIEGVQKELESRNIDEISIDKISNFLDLVISQPDTIQGAIESIIADPNRPEADKSDLWKRQNEAYSQGWIEGSKEILNYSQAARNGLDQFQKIQEYLRGSSAFSRIRFEPSLARGLSYYTGAIMEISVPYLAGSLGGGGRYDGLIGMFGKEQIPACGFSLGLERILVVMEERKMFDKPIAEGKLKLDSADVMVTIWNDDTVADSLKLASELREQGLRVTLYPEADKLGKQFKYADSIKVPFVCVLGETEIAEGKVTVKNLSSGEQQVVERDSVAKFIKEGENSHQR